MANNKMSEDDNVFNDCKQPEELRDVYCFESDHIALKGNPDYQSLLKTICILESQRIQAVKDIDTLRKKQREALADPINFVEKLQKAEDLGFPKDLDIPSLPSINWEQYTSSVDFNSFGNHKHMTRIKRQLTEDSLTGKIQDKSGITSGMKSKLINEEVDMDVVRGRLKDPNKSATFNLLWTSEEQKRLEDLLIKYPPEDVEAKRYHKIATALGNRTAQQVASRVQKYFIKLAKAGLPIPGRTPTLRDNRKYTLGRGYGVRFSNIPQHSTFLQSYEPPVYMSEDDDDTNSYNGSYDIDTSQTNQLGDISDEEEIPAELRNTPEYKEILQLKLIKKQKLASEKKSLKHDGYKCDNCGTDPIVGVRWHCSDCPSSQSLDFCDYCADSNFENSEHNSSHRLKAIDKIESEPILDQDYMRFMPGDYNYLDPNYMPAS
ncbi:hypothetical protein LOTGIDRAFT_187172 [Lottia gigantea]|uniref:ZZ-type domain-containing protein n=1 Tax=Lottia gigantea TaxID=225164 RepID=V4CAU4_LOTGI|nr:hypothetical protein LOTGIDRAFT_187172 [Lottia gigantea]ESO98939.1 hypothetical protein LOTGIDRAFT_187172 [Lottia gigantea]